MDNAAQSALAELFDTDHGRQLTLLTNVEFLCGRESFLPAAKVFGEFRISHDTHASKEEQLIGALLRNHQCSSRLAWRVVREHALLRSLIDQAWSAVARGDPTEIATPMSNLSRFLANHELAEKEALLPALSVARPVQLAMRG